MPRNSRGSTIRITRALSCLVLFCLAFSFLCCLQPRGMCLAFPSAMRKYRGPDESTTGIWLTQTDTANLPTPCTHFEKDWAVVQDLNCTPSPSSRIIIPEVLASHVSFTALTVRFSPRLHTCALCSSAREPDDYLEVRRDLPAFLTSKSPICLALGSPSRLSKIRLA